VEVGEALGKGEQVALGKKATVKVESGTVEVKSGTAEGDVACCDHTGSVRSVFGGGAAGAGAAALPESPPRRSEGPVGHGVAAYSALTPSTPPPARSSEATRVASAVRAMIPNARC
jgi:hypothetical protein